MTDKELLELAAKAAGYEYAKFGGYIVVDGIPGNWNPLTDDGDALRLVVKLMIDIRQFMQYRGQVDCLVDRIGRGFGEDATQDPYAATRRAIVRAAAEVGKGMLSYDEFVLMFPGRYEEEEVERAAAAIGKEL